MTTRTGGLSDQSCSTTGLLFHPSCLGAFGRAEVAAHILPASSLLQSQQTDRSLDIGPGLREEARPILAACISWGPWGLSCVQTLREITDQEHNVAALKQAIKDKEVPLKVAQTRLYQRSHRPNVELCRDTAQFRYEPGVGQVTALPTQVLSTCLQASFSLWDPHHTHHPENVLRRHWGLMLAQLTQAGIYTPHSRSTLLDRVWGALSVRVSSARDSRALSTSTYAVQPSL